MRITSILALLVALALAAAAEPVTWDFDVYTDGDDVTWTSPTALDANATVYTVGWQVTQVIVTVRYSIFPPFDLDVTDQIPPENLVGSECAPGPAPLVAFSGNLAYPEPPAPPAVSADVTIGLDAQGFGYVSATNVVLGTLVVNVPPFGNVEVDVLAVHLRGTVTAEALFYNPCDLNCDGLRNFGDINPFVLALTDADAYAAAFPCCNRRNADINGDGQVDFGDINPFVACFREY